MTRYTSSVVLALAAVATNFHSTQAAVCGTYEVDFGSFARGEYLTTQLKADYGIEVRCSSDEGYGCRIFDTAVAWGEWESGSGCACKMENCSDQKKKDCGDTDLAAPNAACPGGGMGEGEDGGPDAEYPNCEPRGNVLIIDENGPSKPPDDSVNGGKMRFLFDYPTDLDEVCFLDVDGEEQTWLSVYFADDSDPVLNIPVPKIGDGGYGCVPVPYFGVSKLVVKMDGSGSVSDLKYNMCDPTKSGGGGGDPHIQRWNRERSTFHGECDMVMVHSNAFHNNAGFDLHARAVMMDDLYSYFDSAALRVGEHTLEVQRHEIIINGVSHKEDELPLTFGGDFKYTIDKAPVEPGKNPLTRQYYKVNLHEDSIIMFKWYKHLLTIDVDGHENDFSDSTGMLGDYHTGNMNGREGQLMDDFTAYGFEWQVNPKYDPILFQEARGPQLPNEQCRMPSQAMSSRRRLLRSDKVLMEQAQTACAAKKGGDFELCVNDVLLTGDIEMAQAW